MIDYIRLKSISPITVERYLQANGWVLEQRNHNITSIWTKEDLTHGRLVVWVPLNPQFNDYSDMLLKVFKVVSNSRQKDFQTFVDEVELLDIGDVVRYRSVDIYDIKSSTLPIDQGLSLIKNAKDMIQAGACSAHKSMLVYPQNKPNEVKKYMKSIRLGQTERGSYVVKLLSPWPVQVQEPLDTLREGTPFERKSILKMLEGLHTIKAIAMDGVNSGKFNINDYYDAVEMGVSANLCESILNVFDGGYAPVRVGVDWGYGNLLPRPDIISIVEFPPEVMVHIHKAATVIRETSPEEVLIEGYIIKLEKRDLQGPGPGKVTMSVSGSDLLNTLLLELYDEKYKDAIKAHDECLRVRYRGQINKEGKFYKGTKMQEFSVLKGEDNED